MAGIRPYADSRPLRSSVVADSGPVTLVSMNATTALVTATILWLIGTAVGLWVLYYVIKSAIRDGINESQLTDRWRALVVAATNGPARETLPDMRAD